MKVEPIFSHWMLQSHFQISSHSAAAVYVIYQIYFHPLSKHPGPVLCKISSIRASYYGVKGESHLDIHHCHLKYGPIVRYRPGLLLYNNVESLKDIYGVRKNVQKSSNYRWLDHGPPNILSATDKAFHTTRRRTLNPLFTKHSIRKFEPKMLPYLHDWCAAIYQAPPGTEDCGPEPYWGAPMDMSLWCKALAFDLMTDFIFGRKSSMLSKPGNRAVIAKIEAPVNLLARLFYLPISSRLNTLLLKLVNNRHNRFGKYIRSNMESRQDLEPGESHDDVFSHLLTSLERSDAGYDIFDALQSDCTLLSVAGYDTVSTALYATIYHLCQHPDAYAKLQAEITTGFTPEEINAGDKLEHLMYLNACINESMRVSPPIIMPLTRDVQEPGEVVHGMLIPPGYTVGVSIYAIHRNEKYFPQADEFIPERWLDGNTTPDHQVGKVSGQAFNPFSLGPRGCIGQALAYSELRIALAFLIRTYDFKLANSDDGTHRGAGVEELRLHDRMTTDTSGPYVQFRRRRKGDSHHEK